MCAESIRNAKPWNTSCTHIEVVKLGFRYDYFKFHEMKASGAYEGGAT